MAQDMSLAARAARYRAALQQAGIALTPAEQRDAATPGGGFGGTYGYGQARAGGGFTAARAPAPPKKRGGVNVNPIPGLPPRPKPGAGGAGGTPGDINIPTPKGYKLINADAYRSGQANYLLYQKIDDPSIIKVVAGDQSASEALGGSSSILPRSVPFSPYPAKDNIYGHGDPLNFALWAQSQGTGYLINLQQALVAARVNTTGVNADTPAMQAGIIDSNTIKNIDAAMVMANQASRKANGAAVNIFDVLSIPTPATPHQAPPAKTGPAGAISAYSGVSGTIANALAFNPGQTGGVNPGDILGGSSGGSSGGIGSGGLIGGTVSGGGTGGTSSTGSSSGQNPNTPPNATNYPDYTQVASVGSSDAQQIIGRGLNPTEQAQLNYILRGKINETNAANAGRDQNTSFDTQTELDKIVRQLNPGESQVHDYMSAFDTFQAMLGAGGHTTSVPAFGHSTSGIGAG